MHTRAHLDLPATACRALHSGLIDCLTDMPDEVREGFLTRLGGIDFVRFMLALDAGTLAVTTRIDGEDAYIGIAVPTTGRHDRILFELTPGHSGVAASWLLAAGLIDFDARLDEFLRGDDR